MAYENDYILLKWGSLKGWKIENPETLALIKKWANLGVSESAMAHHDTQQQKEIICNIIRAHTGNITNDWSGEEYTKEQAISYIMDYDNAKG